MFNIADGAPPLPYAYFTIPVAALLLTPAVLRRPASVMAEWRGSGWRVPIVALLKTSGYLLVRMALESTQVSHVAPALSLAS